MESKPVKFHLKSTSSVSLNDRFSQVLVDQLSRPSVVTFNPLPYCSSPVVMLLKSERPAFCLQSPDSAPLLRSQQLCQRRQSVWTRLGWRCSSHRGFWSFRKKYSWRARTGSTHIRGFSLRRRLGQRHLQRNRNIQKPTAGRPRLSLSGGGDTAAKRRGLRRDPVPTKKQLDAQLDEYMSMTRSRLDQQLEDYMSRSKSCLDAQLDEYMAMAGQTPLWD